MEIPSLKDKNILITGGAGFLGTNLARRLVNQNANVTLFIREGKNLENIQDIKEKVKIIEGDLTNQEQVKEAIQEKDYLFHFAWQTDLKKSMANPKEDINSDIIGLINVLESCRKFNPNIKIIFASTVTVIGDAKNIPSNEDEKENPLSIYEVNKLSAEKYLQMYYQNYNLKE